MPATVQSADAPPVKPVRIGEVAELVGVTPRTIRYWEELGLLGVESERAEGKHRSYTPAEVQRVQDIVRLRNLLGLSLEELSTLLEAESARAQMREELRHVEAPAERRRLLTGLQGNIGGQLELVRGRQRELTELAAELEGKLELIRDRIAELDRA